MTREQREGHARPGKRASGARYEQPARGHQAKITHQLEERRRSLMTSSIGVAVGVVSRDPEEQTRSERFTFAELPFRSVRPVTSMQTERPPDHLQSAQEKRTEHGVKR